MMQATSPTSRRCVWLAGQPLVGVAPAPVVPLARASVVEQTANNLRRSSGIARTSQCIGLERSLRRRRRLRHRVAVVPGRARRFGGRAGASPGRVQHAASLAPTASRRASTTTSVDRAPARPQTQRRSPPSRRSPRHQTLRHLSSRQPLHHRCQRRLWHRHPPRMRASGSATGTVRRAAARSPRPRMLARTATC